MNVSIGLRKAIEFGISNDPDMITNRNKAKMFLLHFCFNCIKKYKIPQEKWPTYLTLIKILLEEYCSTE